MNTLQAKCPVCDEQVKLEADTEVSEIVNCSDCNNRLVIEKIDKNKVVLSEAPEIDEDWGE